MVVDGKLVQTPHVREETRWKRLRNVRDVDLQYVQLWQRRDLPLVEIDHVVRGKGQLERRRLLRDQVELVIELDRTVVSTQIIDDQLTYGEFTADDQNACDEEDRKIQQNSYPSSSMPHSEAEI